MSECLNFTAMPNAFDSYTSIGVCRVLLALCTAAFGVACDSPRVVYTGGDILTMNASNEVVDAIGVEGERIAAVGSRDEVLAWAGHDARIIDIEGGTIVPGFIDAHGHFPGEGIYSHVLDLNAPPIGRVNDMQQLKALLSERATETAEGNWVLGMSYDDTLLAEQRHPNRRDLDLVSTKHPIAITHVSGHLAAVNSMALSRAGIDRDSEDPEGGVLRRFEDGELSGVLEETATHFFDEIIQSPSMLEGLEVLREANRRAVAQGVTTVQNGLAPAGMISLFDWATWFGLATPRIVVWPSMEVADAVLDGDFSLPASRGPDLWIGAIKLVADGSIQGYTGYLGEPYHVLPDGLDPGFRGYPRIARDELRERVTRYHAAGFQLAVHGNGDAAIGDILDAFEHAFVAQPREDARPIIIHAQMARPDQLDRMATLGVIPSFFSLHTFYWGDRHRERFMGPDRAAHMSPAASALGKGVRFTIHCDAPVVPLEPLRLVWSAVNRRTRSGFVVGAAERIDAMQALRAVTIDAAFSMFLDDEVGSLEVGKFADLAILSGSPLVNSEAIDQLEVVETIRGGETIYQSRDE